MAKEYKIILQNRDNKVSYDENTIINKLTELVNKYTGNNKQDMTITNFGKLVVGKERNIIENENFGEKYISTSIEECEKRDVKGLYKKARDGEIKNFTGIDSPYEPPENAEVTVDTTGKSIEESAEEIINYLKSRKVLQGE